MPKNIRNKVETEFKASDRMTRSLGIMSRGMQRLERMSGRVKRGLLAAGRAARFVGRVLATGFKIGAGIAVGAIGLVTAAVWKLSSAFSMIEDAEAGFTPLMGSVERARALVEALNKTAATTPFQFETLSDTAKQLLPSMNGDIERTIQLTRMLGDTAGGNAQKMESITRGFNKALIKGKVDLEALNMIAEAGVPIFQELGKVTGVSGKRLFKNISAGKVSVEQLTKTFESMTSKGGIFFEGMEIASTTLTGKISTLKDNVTLAMAKIGGAMAPVLKDATDKLIVFAQKISDWASANQELIKQKFELYFNKFVNGLKNAYQWVIDNKEEIKKFGYEIKNTVRTISSVIKKLWENRESIIAIAIAFNGVGIALKASSWLSTLKKATEATKRVEDASKEFTGSLTNGLLEPLSKQEMMNNRWDKMSKIVGAGGLLFSAFSAGWAVGKAIFNEMDSAMDNIITKATNASSRIGMMVSKMENKELDVKFKELERTKGGQDSLWTGVQALLTGRFGELEEARGTTRQAQIDILEEKLRRLGGGSAQAPTAETPQAQVSRSETITREVTEVVIRDETGRAEVTKGKSANGLTLAHTGAM